MVGQSRSKLMTVGIHVSLMVLVVWAVMPFLWTFFTSIKFTRDAVRADPVFWGFEPTASAYEAFWFDEPPGNLIPVGLYLLSWILVPAILGLLARRVERRWPFYIGMVLFLGAAILAAPSIWETSQEYEFFINSIIVTTATVLISISIGIVAGYGLARYVGISGAVILIVALAFRALPRTAFVIPYFFGAKSLGLLDSRLIIILALVAVNQPFTIWMLRSFFMEIPKSLDEAAQIDGASRFQTLRKVVVPIMWPGIIATSLFTLLLAYNEFLFVRVLAVTEWTLPVAIVALTGGESSRTLTEAAAASVSITLPIVIVIIVFQKHLVKGLGAGAVKG